MPRLAAMLALTATVLCGCASLRPTQPEALVPGGNVLHFRWRRVLTPPPLIEYKPQEFASAATDGRRVYIGSTGGVFYALDPGDGAVVWKKAIGGGVSSQPLYLRDTDTVYVGGGDGALYALDPVTGAERWTYRTKGSIRTAPIYSDGLIYFVNGESRVYALDAQSGAWRWQYERETPEGFSIRGVGAPLVADGQVYAGFPDGYLVSLNARTGDVTWARSLAGTAKQFVDVDATPVMADGTLYAASYSGGVYALDPSSGGVRWNYEVEGAAGLWVERGRVYFTAAKAGVHCLDTAGHVVWRQALGGQGSLSPPVLVDGRYLMLSASDSGSFVADAASGTLLQFFHPGNGVTSAPVSDGRSVYVLTNSGYFYAFGL